MQLIKLLFCTLAVCFCSFVSAQHPALLTRYNWNATTNSWQQQAREIHLHAAPQQEVVLTQVWDDSQRSWEDWTRTTTECNDVGQLTFSLTEKKLDGAFVKVIQKIFSFDPEGRLLTQVDQRWDQQKGSWENLYKEVRKYAHQFGEEQSTLSERIIMGPDASRQGWEVTEKYSCFQFVVGDGVQHFSRRHVMIDGTLVLVDQLVTRITDSGREEVLMEGTVGDWTPVSKKLTETDGAKSSLSHYSFSNLTNSWEEMTVENRFFNERGDLSQRESEKILVSYSYDEEGRIQAVFHSNPLQENAPISKEIYTYEDQLALSYEPARFDMVLYPNPARQAFQLKLSQTIPGNSVLKIMDLQGRLIEQTTFNAASNTAVFGDDLSAGTYLVQLISAQGVKTSRLVVTK